MRTRRLGANLGFRGGISKKIINNSYRVLDIVSKEQQQEQLNPEFKEILSMFSRLKKVEDGYKSDVIDTFENLRAMYGDEERILKLMEESSSMKCLGEKLYKDVLYSKVFCNDDLMLVGLYVQKENYKLFICKTKEVYQDCLKEIDLSFNKK